MIDKKEVKKPRKSVRIAREFRSQFVITFSTLFTSAFALVAAFAWNDLVKEVIERYVTSGQTMISRLVYALLVTLLAVLISFQFGKIAASFKIEKEDEEARDKRKS